MCVYIARLYVDVCACVCVCVQVVYVWGYMSEVCMCLCIFYAGLRLVAGGVVCTHTCMVR